jgi:hypothetical protein
MFKFGVLVALISLVFVHCKSPLLDLVDDDLSSSVASAIAQFFNHVSKDRVKGFDVIVYGNETSRLEKIGNGIGKSIRIPYRYRKLDKQADEALIFLKLDRPAVFLLDSWFEYIQFLSQASAKKNQGLNFLYYVENQLYMPNALGGNSTFMERHSEMFQHFPQFYSDYFLNVNESLITLTTYDKFSPPNCNETHLIEMNEFSQTKGKWKSANFVKKKFVNLNQCEIVADMLYPQNLALQVDFNAERNATTFRGYVIKFNEIISEKMNFTFKCNPVKMVVSDNPKVFYDIAYKVTGIGAMIYEVYSFRHLTKHEGRRDSTDLEVQAILNAGKSCFAFPTCSLVVAHWIIDNVGRDFWTDMDVCFEHGEKVRFWFESQDAVAEHDVSLMLILEQESDKFRPSYVVFGGGLFILPRRNFARFNLMLFILFCLVIRTAYQGVQFTMMFEVRSLRISLS